MKLSELMQEIIKEFDNPEKREINFKIGDSKTSFALFFDPETVTRKAMWTFSRESYNQVEDALTELLSVVMGEIPDARLCAQVIIDAIIAKAPDAKYSIGTNEASGRYVSFGFGGTTLWFRFDHDPKPSVLNEALQTSIEEIAHNPRFGDGSFSLSNRLGGKLVFHNHGKIEELSESVAIVDVNQFELLLAEMVKDFGQCERESFSLETTELLYSGFRKVAIKYGTIGSDLVVVTENTTITVGLMINPFTKDEMSESKGV